MDLHTARQDLGAAVVGALATLPQAVAYGFIAVSPLGAEWAVFGITASVGTAIFFGFLSGVFSSNRFMLSGPTAVTALVLAAGIQAGLERGYAPSDALFFGLAGVVVAGLFQAASGFLRLGQAVSYVPVPVLSGFVNASALLVFLSALPTVLGAPDSTIRTIFSAGAGMISPWAATVGGLTILTTFVLENRLRLVPAALVGVVVGTAAYTLGNTAFGMPAAPLVGAIDIGELWRLPLLIDPGLNWAGLWREADIPVLTGLSIGFLASFNSVVSSSALSLRTGETSEANHDLRVHGLINAVTGLLGFLPGSGTISRSSAILEAGAKTRSANAGSGVVFGLMLFGLAPLVAALPLWATAGMLVVTALQAFDKPTFEKAWRVLLRRIPYPRVVIGDLLITLAVVVTALFVDLIAAVGAGVLLSVVLFVLGMGRNPVRRVYRGSRVHSKIQRHPAQSNWLEKEGHRIAVLEVQGALFFGSCARLQSEAKALLEHGVEYLILDFRHLTSIDSTGAAALRALHLLYAETGGRLFVSYIEPERRNGANGRRQDAGNGQKCRRRKVSPRWTWLNLEANGVIYTIGRDRFFEDTDTALAGCEELLLKRFGKSSAPRFRGIIASSSLFSGLARDQIAHLGGIATRHRFRAGETVFRQGEKGDCAYFLVFGRMDVLIDIPGTSRKRRVSSLTEGTLFGEVGLIDRASRSASVVASSDSICFSIDADKFGALQRQRPDLVSVLLLNLSHLFASRLRLANVMISELEQ